MLITFALGIGIGVAVAAAIGPISLLCVRRTLTHGTAVGLASGLGVAVADALYGSIAAFGLTLVSGFLIAQSHWFALVGGSVLICLGVAIFREQPSDSVSDTGAAGLLGALASTFVLTLANPMTILSFAAIFAGLGVPLNQGDYVGASVLVAGIFTGSALWWL